MQVSRRFIAGLTLIELLVTLFVLALLLNLSTQACSTWSSRRHRKLPLIACIAISAIAGGTHRHILFALDRFTAGQIQCGQHHLDLGIRIRRLDCVLKAGRRQCQQDTQNGYHYKQLYQGKAADFIDIYLYVLTFEGALLGFRRVPDCVDHSKSYL